MRIQVLIFSLAALTAGAIKTDPLLFFKNNSDRTVHIEPFAQGTAFAAQRVKPEGEAVYNAADLGTSRLDGVRVKYCLRSDPNYMTCNTFDNARSMLGTTYEFRFTPSAAEKYYLKLTIDKMDKPSLKPQDGVAGRTSNLKWKLSGNINAKDIKGPIAAAPTDMPPSFVKTSDSAKATTDKTAGMPALPNSATSPKRKAPDRPTIPAPIEDEDIAITLMPETLEQKTIIPTPAQPSARPVSVKQPAKGQYENELKSILVKEDAYIKGLEQMIANNSFDEMQLKDSLFQQSMNKPISVLLRKNPAFNAAEDGLFQQHSVKYRKATELLVKARSLARNVKQPAAISAGEQLPVEVISFTKMFPSSDIEEIVEKYVTKTFNPAAIERYTNPKTKILNLHEMRWVAPKNIANAIKNLPEYIDSTLYVIKPRPIHAEPGEMAEDLARRREQSAEESNIKLNNYPSLYYYYKLGESALLYDPKALQYKDQIKQAIEAEREKLRNILGHKLFNGRYVVEYLVDFDKAH